MYSFYLIFLTLLINKAAGFRSRIIGGTDGSIVEFPYQVSVHYEGSHICGGAIITPSVVITAAHCLLDLHKDRLSVAAGSTLASRGLGEKRQVLAYKIHERYNDEETDFDIGLIKVIGTFKYGLTLQPVKIADLSDLLPNGAIATVTGWGFTQEDGYIVKTLRQGKIPIVSRLNCRKLYQEVGTVTENMICAGMGGRDACQGDSGGPLVYRGKLIGLVSWGYGCARTNYPGVYTNVAKFNNWIRINSIII